MSTCVTTEVIVNGVKMVPANSVKSTTGDRVVLVVDRGWIFAGDLVKDAPPGRLQLTNVVWVMRWESVGFNGMIDNPKDPKVHLRKMDQLVDIPTGAEIFRVYVPSDWGL